MGFPKKGSERYEQIMLARRLKKQKGKKGKKKRIKTSHLRERPQRDLSSVPHVPLGSFQEGGLKKVSANSRAGAINIATAKLLLREATKLVDSIVTD